jgi:hypothetical protein
MEKIKVVFWRATACRTDWKTQENIGKCSYDKPQENRLEDSRWMELPYLTVYVVTAVVLNLIIVLPQDGSYYKMFRQMQNS